MESFAGELDGQFTLFQSIGAGAFSKVKLAIHVLTNEKVAIKIIDKGSIGKDLHRVYLEIAALQEFAHQYICKLYQVIYVVLEYCQGGELFDYVVQVEQLDENKARHSFRHIVSAVAHVHRRGYAQRDLKPENHLLDSDGNIKLVDLGLCAKTKSAMSVHLSTPCRNAAYAAPELVAGLEYVGSGDNIWSIGVLLYVVVCGRLPFSSDNTGILFRMIQMGKYNCPESLSDMSVRLLSPLMVTCPYRRITMAQLVNHPWLVEGYKCPASMESTCLGSHPDHEVVDEVAVGCGRPKHSVAAKINRRKCDYTTATYHLLVETIGTGAFAKVKIAIHVMTDEKVAIKIIDKCSIGKDLIRAYLEIVALRDFAHQYICKLYQVIETKHRIYLVPEYCPGGELFDYLKRERLREDKARHPLRPDNLLLDADEKIKLVDLGLCAKTKSAMSAHLRTFCRSAECAAPELVAGWEYVGSGGNIWSMEVLHIHASAS
ncbi:hypothetical protein HPB50_003366 [Hyalomma asiaticum]|uniref:Uncharacterized protein n=1 Tax=Hyalomma asiaticum TaxID=266040 RepID=A0ACB7TGH8_HYAAI|nr:hypothetical protein HPB50_003366 [Hyalomma asiaticum]